MNILIESNDFQLNGNLKSIIKEVIIQALEEEGYPLSVEVSVTFVDNESIRKLNKEYRNIDKETDVLSFPLLEFEESDEEKDVKILLDDLDAYKNPESGDIMLGDIIISYEKAKEQAEEYGHSLEREIGFLVAHSMFHLMGYDHMTKEEEEIMCKKQEKVLESIGLTR
ncbi:MAG TPA: rRNA maturation RNase YbeY [Defluviitaleaceae bacterium]|nr:rRNA maturation RNase YbeY [Candidatus Epulonipiscium sp.]HQD51035.1 rRNA maturation RNase YbeY [Defluviitaleaceae bacterium]